MTLDQLIAALVLNIVGTFAVALAILRGGRYERLVALFCMVRGELVHLFLVRLSTSNHYAVFTRRDHLLRSVLEAGFLLAVCWLLYRCRRRWLVVLVAGQATVVGIRWLHLAMPASKPHFLVVTTAAALLPFGALIWATLAHSLAPPAPVPGQRDFDASLALGAEGTS